MTATADKAKIAGFDSLAELSALSGKTTTTLRAYDRDKPDLWNAAVERALTKKQAMIKRMEDVE